MKKFFKSFLIMVFAVAMMAGLFAKKPETSNDANAYVIETNDSTFLSGLLNSTETLESSYDMSKIYPLICENQTYSDFCWLYSSSKALETAFMVQRQEYYNVSEVAMGYLHYLDRIEEGAGASDTLSIGGNFYDYVNLYQKYGIIPESDVSNDIYGLEQAGQINYGNYEYYSYIEDYADTSLYYENDDGVNTYANAYNMTEHMASLSTAGKIKVTKNFIKNYGGLFAGIEHGVFYEDNNGVCYFTSDLTQQGYGTVVIPEGSAHAVTLIGWNDNIEIDGRKGAFLAMNSWGLGSTDYEYFYVSYYYNANVEFDDNGQPVVVNVDIFDALYGFVLNEAEELVTVTGTTATNFNKNLYTSSDLTNVFTCDDRRVAIEYKLAVNSLDTISVKVSNGKTDLTGKFETDYDNSTKTIIVTLDDKTEFYGGYYSIKFYQNGNLLATKTIYIVSGTESGYFVVADEFGYIDSFALNNTFLSSNNNATLYLSGDKSYVTLTFNLTPLNEWSKIGNDFTFSISNAKIYSSNSSLSSLSSSTIVSNYFSCGTGDTYYVSNSYEIMIKSLSALKNSMVSFSVDVESILYDDVVRTYYFDVFVSPNNVTSKNSYVINYELDGGNNSNENIVRMPNYSLDSSMVGVALENPTKPNANFLGWYLNPEFTGGQVNAINSSLLSSVKNGAVTLYAKWESTEVEYFDIDFDLVGVTDYQDQDKALDADVIYGDSLKYLLTFVALEGLNSAEYTTMYYFYINGVAGNEFYLSNGSQTANIAVNFPELVSGDYTFGVKVIVTVNRILSVEKTAYLDISVGKKLVEFEFSDLRTTYDGEGHYPTVSVKSGSFYEEDLDGVNIADLYNMSDDIARVNAGSYEFYVDSLNNSNYYFVADDATCTLVIDRREVVIAWNSYDVTYNGSAHIPTCVVKDIEDDSVILDITFTLTDADFVNAGLHSVNIIPNTISNANYFVNLTADFEYEIKKAPITVVMSGAKDRFQTAVEHRAQPSYQVFGTVYGNDNLGVTIINNADYATKSGKYLITCTISNSNYSLTVQDAIYELTGVYRVSYHLPDGTVIHEDVEEGKLPLGLSEEQIDLPMFSRLIYSQNLAGVSGDTHISVEIEDYSGTVYVIGFVILFIVICVIYYFKKRGNGVR